MVAPGCARPNTPRSDPKDWAELAEPLRSRAHQLAQDYGLVLVSGYRDAGRQWDLRRERCPGRECSSSCKGYPVTARPGTSDHQNRTAADLGGRRLTEAMAQRERYGLALTVPSEIWHVSADRLDVRTKRIHNRPTARIVPFDAPDEGRSYRTGDFGEVVRAIQVQLNKAWKHRITDTGRTGGGQIKADGHYGGQTQTAVREFERFVNRDLFMQGRTVGIPEDGVADPVVQYLLAVVAKGG